MPRSAKGPRLYLRRGRIDSKTRQSLPDVWVIRDGQTQRSTGFGPDGLPGAEQALQNYIAAKWAPDEVLSVDSRRDPAKVGVAEVLALFAQQRAPELAADPVTTAGFVKHLTLWWGDKYVADVRRSTCKAYVAWRIEQTVAGASKTERKVSPQTARRELETLSSAIGFWHGEDALTTRLKVWLPEKPESPRDALTRPQAARLMRAARGWRRNEDGSWTALSASARANRRHLARFILIGLYTGTRSAVIRALLWEESPNQAWVDLDAGMIYRRGKLERDHRNKRRPVVKLPTRLLGHLRRWRKIDAALQAARRPSKHAEASGNRSFTLASVIHHGGDPIRTKINKGFSAIVADAGLSDEVTPHWLRHTCATWLMEAGVESRQAAAFTGMTTAVLERHYGHHRPDYQSGAASAAGGRR
ncbi:MAG: integrase family protein [Caulobacteraceae bacterium]|nr:integrase family protein [Caulobacteraceae bacterium]